MPLCPLTTQIIMVTWQMTYLGREFVGRETSWQQDNHILTPTIISSVRLSPNKRVAKGFYVMCEGPKISRVTLDGPKISRVMRDWTSQRDA